MSDKEWSLVLRAQRELVLTEEERKNIGSSLRNYVVNNFSMEQFISSHEELYLKLAKK